MNTERLGGGQRTCLDGREVPEGIFQGLETERPLLAYEILIFKQCTVFGLSFNISQKNSEIVTMSLF